MAALPVLCNLMVTNIKLGHLLSISPVVKMSVPTSKTYIFAPVSVGLVSRRLPFFCDKNLVVLQIKYDIFCDDDDGVV